MTAMGNSPRYPGKWTGRYTAVVATIVLLLMLIQIARTGTL